MREAKLEEFRMWMEAQPDYCSYSRVRNFLSGLLDCSNAEAEVEMAQLQQDDEIKIIARKTGSSGRRVFLKPLPELQEGHIRSVWNSEHASKSANKIAAAVHDKTGHDVSDVKEFMSQLDNAKITNDSFRWETEDIYGDENEYIRDD